MKTDVQTLIAALTTERNSLTRAIVALEQISPVQQAKAPAAARASRKRRVHHNDETKAAIVARMQDAQPGAKYGTALACSREFGGSVSGIYTNWAAWRHSLQLRGATPTPSNGSGEPAAIQ